MWRDTAAMPEYGRLEGDVRTDVLVIGGGMAGILCAHFLRQAGVDCVLAEADRLCAGTTGNTTAKITSQHGLVYDGLLRRFGAEKAGMYLHANEAALARYRGMCREIDCGFEEKDAFVYSLDDRGKLEKELAALEKLGFHAGFTDKLPLPFPVAGAVRFERQAQFDPLRFAAAAARGLRAYEHTPVRRLEGTSAVTDRGTIRAEKVIVATHFPFLNRHGSYFSEDVPAPLLCACAGKRGERGRYVCGRGRGGPVLPERAGNAAAGRRQPPHGKAGRRMAGAGSLCKAALSPRPHTVPLGRAGLHDAGRRALYRPVFGPHGKPVWATGFNKWGMTSAMAAAMLLTDMVQGKRPDDAPVFSPSRSMLRPQLALNALEAAASLCFTPTAPALPRQMHGCALKWNAQEHSWDCVTFCHGSRFTREGGQNIGKTPRCGTLSWKGERRGFGSAASFPPRRGR